MKQNINPMVAVAVVVGVLIIAVISAVWALRGPSVAAGRENQKPIPRAEMDKHMRESHQGPTPEQMKKIQEWKQAHPNGYTTH